jgi:hypothetical protein
MILHLIDKLLNHMFDIYLLSGNFIAEDFN